MGGCLDDAAVRSDVEKRDDDTWSWAAQVTADNLLWGQGVALVIRDSDGVVRELHRLSPSAVVTRADPLTSVYQYGLGESGSGRPVRATAVANLIVVRATIRAACGSANALNRERLLV